MINYTNILIFFAAFFGGLVLHFLLTRKSSTDQEQNRSIHDLERRITDLMSLQIKEIRGTVDGSSKQMMSQVRSFTQETTELKKDLKSIQEKVGDISSFQDIFRSPKLRGQWGEASLEHILGQHFPPEFYQSQYPFSSGETVDMILKLPNGKILPIDSKFSFENFTKMIQSSGQEKQIFSQKFIQDTKKRIQETSKYVSPSENTVGYAIMYIPAEAVYYEIMFNLIKEDLANHAWKNKVILTSPNTLYLTLNTIEHWFKNAQISKRTEEVLKRLEKIRKDSAILFNDFQKLGKHISDTSSAYQRSEKRLSLFDQKVDKLIQLQDKKQLKNPKE